MYVDWLDSVGIPHVRNPLVASRLPDDVQINLHDLILHKYT